MNHIYIYTIIDLLLIYYVIIVGIKDYDKIPDKNYKSYLLIPFSYWIVNFLKFIKNDTKRESR